MCGCFVVLAQIVVFISNLVIMLLGGLATGAGVLIKVFIDSSLEALQIEDLPDVSDLKVLVIPLIVAGVVIFVFGITGCIGATCKVICCLILNVAGFVILAVMTIYLLVKWIQLLAQTESFINDLLSEYLFNNNAAQNGTFQLIEYTLRCCGVNGTDSYVAAGLPIPPTCCTNNTDAIDIAAITPGITIPPGANITCHSIGCGTVLSDYVLEYGSIFKIALIIIVCLEIVTIGFDMLIACSKKKK
ncbi:hypothetical protein O3G_MSEX007305 [Manduca sexta]|uniref:Tetraspanin n=1 Tax=Manduca sexta TaxID=7130 RepID=A0A921Z5Z9_MANSE|nr:hypothetical protein O3G_MSEX007305 [Manduca sexta]